MKLAAMIISVVLLGLAGCGSSDDETHYRKVILLDGTMHFVVFSKKCSFPALCTTLYEVGTKEPE